MTKYIKQLGGPDLRDSVGQLPCSQGIEDVWLEPTELADEFGFSSAKVMNRFLEELGLQRKTRFAWKPTKKAMGLFNKHAWAKGSKSGYNLKWNARAIERLIDKKLSA